MKKTVGFMLALTLMAALSGCAKKETPAETTAKATEAAKTETVAATEAAEPEWPNGEVVTLLVPNKAGSSTDNMCRIMAAGLEKELNTTVVVEDMEGSSGWNCWNHLLKNVEKDGLTFASVNMNIVFGEYDPTNPREFGLDDFTLLANQVGDISGFAIAPDETRFSTLDELVEYSKDNVLYTALQSTGVTNGDSAVLEWFVQNYGCQFEIVPVDSSNDAIAMMLGGNIDFLVASVSNFSSLEKNGEISTIALFGAERSTMMPEIPTAMEQGYELTAFSARGYAYPNGVDPKIVEKLAAAMEKVISDPEIQGQLADLGQETLMLVGDDYTKALEAERAKRLGLFNIQQ